MSEMDKGMGRLIVINCLVMLIIINCYRLILLIINIIVFVN